MKRENSAPSALALLLAAFEGMPVQGCHELRLSAQEHTELAALFPAAVFRPLDTTADGKRWYEVSI